MNGLVMAIGGLGGVMVGSPLTWAARVRELARGLRRARRVLTVLVAVAQWTLAPDTKETHHQASLGAQFKGTWHILKQRGVLEDRVVLGRDARRLLRDAVAVGRRVVCATCMGFEPREAAALVSILGFAMMAGCVGFGAAARSLERRGVSLYAFCGIGMALYVLTQLLIMFRAPLPAGSAVGGVRDLRRHRHSELRGAWRGTSRRT